MLQGVTVQIAFPVVLRDNTAPVVATLRKRILIGYGITLALMVVVLVWAVVNLVGLGRASNAILRENYKSILAAENMINVHRAAGQRHAAGDARLRG